ncbi:hypothetical protein FCR2A7T_12540 [Flavobacterium cauense R2A-7]|nr:hypothetical protein FCR2A7T_12540 [Flavobacterium cauense R2A-7]
MLVSHFGMLFAVKISNYKINARFFSLLGYRNLSLLQN